MRTTLVVVSFTSLLAACGGGGGGSGADARPIGDTGGGSGACTADEAGYGSPTPSTPFAFRDAPTAPENVGGGGFITNNSPQDGIFLNLYKGFGVYTTGEITPQMVTLTGAEAQGKDCGACLEVDTDIDDDGNTTDIYLANGGTLDITSVSPMLTFTLSNGTFRHVDIVDDDTFETQDSADGCQTTISSLSFSAMVEDDGGGSGSATARTARRKGQDHGIQFRVLAR